MVGWIKGRIGERTSLDGMTLAWAGLAWGVITLLKKEG